MEKEKNILFTFDYELFLGKRCGLVNECLINPTNSVLSILNAYQIRGIFFVDTLYLSKISKINSNAVQSDFALLKSQLANIISSGHFVFPHIHSHWLDAQYLPEINQWDLSNNSKYRLHSLNKDEKRKVFADSFEILNRILPSSALHYKINAFRAGGWSIQPFEAIREYFLLHGIKNDFSVLKGFAADTSAQSYIFLNAPEKPVYSFEDDVLVEQSGGSFKEFSISSIHLTPFEKWLDKVCLKYLFLRGDKGGFGRGESQSKVIINSVHHPDEMVSIELLTFPKLKRYLTFLHNHPFMHFISHPKMFSRHNLKIFNKFLEIASSKYVLQTDFRKIN